jgi:hypothetical protein
MEAEQKIIRVQEASYRNYFTSTFETALVEPCKRVREANGFVVHNQCVNNFNCCNAFGSPGCLRTEILQFRKNMWSPPIDIVKWGPDKRKLVMITYLKSCKCAFVRILFV